MDTKQAPRGTGPSAHTSLVGTIAIMCAEFRHTRDELISTLRENQELRRQLESLRGGLRALAGADLGALRRRVAFYCHPDRGGDAALMSSLNALFDVLGEHVREPALAAERRAA